MKKTWRRENHVNLKLRPYISYSNKLRKYFKTLRLSHVFFNKRSSISLYYLGQLCDILTRLLARLTAPPSFSSPEPTILLACGRNRELWEQPFWNNKGNNRILPIRSRVVCIYGACLKWLLPEPSIPAAGQKDRRLWGREWCGSWRAMLWAPSEFFRQNNFWTGGNTLFQAQFLSGLEYYYMLYLRKIYISSSVSLF